MTMLRACGLLDVFKPLSDCRQESVEKMEWRILGFRIYIGFRLAVPPLPHTRYRYCFAGMSLQRVFVLLFFVCVVHRCFFSGNHAGRVCSDVGCCEGDFVFEVRLAFHVAEGRYATHSFV